MYMNKFVKYKYIYTEGAIYVIKNEEIIQGVK